MVSQLSAEYAHLKGVAESSSEYLRPVLSVPTATFVTQTGREEMNEADFLHGDLTS